MTFKWFLGINMICVVLRQLTVKLHLNIMLMYRKIFINSVNTACTINTDRQTDYKMIDIIIVFVNSYAKLMHNAYTV